MKIRLIGEQKLAEYDDSYAARLIEQGRAAPVKGGEAAVKRNRRAAGKGREGTECPTRAEQTEGLPARSCGIREADDGADEREGTECPTRAEQTEGLPARSCGIREADDGADTTKPAATAASTDAGADGWR